MIYITGDKHGNFETVISYSKTMGLRRKDIIIVLGDAGLNYFGDERDDLRKSNISKAQCTFLCIHGNHEQRPWHNSNNIRIKWNDGYVYQDKLYSNILYAEDGSIFQIQGKSFGVLGGAYSIDKEYRLQYGYRWFEDEQPSAEIKRFCENQLAAAEWKVDYVLSHTGQLKFEPKEAFLKEIDQNIVDKTTEDWLDYIEDKLSYKKWFFGHYHICKREEKYSIFFNEIDAMYTE